MKKYTTEEWINEGKRLFGNDRKTWKFKCVQCGHVQSYNDFLRNGIAEDQADRLIAFSCIGRVVPDRGCDWTLGGLFKIHKAEVDNVPAFEFAEPGIERDQV